MFSSFVVYTDWTAHLHVGSIGLNSTTMQSCHQLVVKIKDVSNLFDKHSKE